MQIAIYCSYETKHYETNITKHYMRLVMFRAASSKLQDIVYTRPGSAEPGAASSLWHNSMLLVHTCAWANTQVVNILKLDKFKPSLCYAKSGAVLISSLIPCGSFTSDLYRTLIQESRFYCMSSGFILIDPLLVCDIGLCIFTSNLTTASQELKVQTALVFHADFTQL